MALAMAAAVARVLLRFRTFRLAPLYRLRLLPPPTVAAAAAAPTCHRTTLAIPRPAATMSPSVVATRGCPRLWVARIAAGWAVVAVVGRRAAARLSPKSHLPAPSPPAAAITTATATAV